MRTIHLGNEQQRNTKVGFSAPLAPSPIRFVLPDGTEKITVRIIERGTAGDIKTLLANCGDLESVGEALIAGDPEFDALRTGMIIDRTRRVYVDGSGDPVYSLRFEEVLKNPDGSEKARRPVEENPGNINNDIPLVWTGKIIPKEKAVRKLVFSRAYQLFHHDGVSYDFLFNMAKQLDAQNGILLLGAGKDGSSPIVLSDGGSPYRGFLEGRTKGKSYMLTLHLTNLELKELNGRSGV